MTKMQPDEVPLTDEIAKRCGFINLAAMENYRAKKDKATLDSLLVEVCNLGQMLLATKKQVEELESRLVATGTERIG